MHDGLLLVPLTAKFAFISPTLLVDVMPLLAIFPIAGDGEPALCRSPRSGLVWRVRSRSGAGVDDRAHLLECAANVLQLRLSPDGRDDERSQRVHYFVHRLVFTHDVAPIFGPYLFAPVTRAVFAFADRFKALQSGQLNFYLALIGILLVVILALVLY